MDRSTNLHPHPLAVLTSDPDHLPCLDLHLLARARESEIEAARGALIAAAEEAERAAGEAAARWSKPPRGEAGTAAARLEAWSASARHAGAPRVQDELVRRRLAVDSSPARVALCLALARARVRLSDLEGAASFTLGVALTYGPP